MVDHKRNAQLGFFTGDCCIKQDQDLIDLVKRHKFSQAYGYGDVAYFAEFVEFVRDKRVDFCIAIVNEIFDFEQLCHDVNEIITDHMNPAGLIYLAINKYLVKPRCYAKDLNDDYDQAILQFVSNNVKAYVQDYQACGIDHGNRFNWVHPLTRFLLKVPA